MSDIFNVGLKLRIAELEAENKQLRIAMDFLLRSPAGTVPREADKFYRGLSATFQEEE